jgi:hypothetical protein
MERGGLDVTIDERTWQKSLYLVMYNRMKGKKTNKGGQHKIAVEVQSWYMYA